MRAIMHGAAGRMGAMISNLSAEADITIVAGVDRITDVDRPYPMYDSVEAVKEDADVVIDFSTAAAVDQLLRDCVSKGLPLVLCTTGLSDTQLSAVEDASKKIAILRSANMSLGINLLLKTLRDITPVLNDAGFDIEIVEKHHRMKLDAPSGTAIALADAANDALAKKKDCVFDRSGRRAERPDSEIGISAVRGGTIVGDHDVIFAGTDEVITLSHRAYSRAVFAKGALAAAAFLAGRPHGLYTMADVIGTD